METKIIQINGENTNYTITTEGKVINSKSGKELKVNNSGVVQLSIHGKNRGRRVARLVADAFIPNPNPEMYLYATNIDGDKMNNKVENIKWITSSENGMNTWEIRRQNGTTNAGCKLNMSKNIVEKSEKFTIQNNEKRIYIDGEKTPFVITKEGVLRNLITGNILKGSVLASYPTVNLCWNGKQKNKSFHRLVAETWIPNPDNLPVVDHIDGDRLNYNADNLRWITYKENNNNIHKNIRIERKKYDRPILTKEEEKLERWKYNEKTHYMVSDMGRVKNSKGEILTGTTLDCGYCSYQLYDKKTKILGHILVWETFNEKDKPQDKVINHINGNKMDNRLSNLELITQKENMQKAATETNAWNFRKVAEINEKGEIVNIYNNASEAARTVGILPSSMRNTIRRKGKCSNGLRYEYIEN